MALNYKRMTEEDFSRLSVLEAGEYQFYVGTVEEKQSKGGHDKHGQPKQIYDMLEVNLHVIGLSGAERKVKDWVLVVANEDAMGFKLRHFADTCGLIDRYDAGILEARDFLGKHGIVKISIRDYTDKYGEKKKQNSVVDYLKPLHAKDAAKAPADGEFFNDEIPF